MNITEEKIEELLGHQAWIEPGPEFTMRVMDRVSVERAKQHAPVMETRRAHWQDRALMALPVVVILVLLTPYMHYVGDFAMDRLREAAFWLGSTTKFPLFAAYPILLLAIVAPIFAGAVSACAISGRCRITRALTS